MVPISTLLTKKTKYNKSVRNSCLEGLFDIFNYSFFTLLALLTLFPFWNVLVVSITDYEEYVRNPLLLWPEKFFPDAYRYIFSSGDIVNAMKTTIFVTIFGTGLNMVLTVGGAYALSKKTLPYRNIILTFILFTMFFESGLIPYYLQIKRLHLIDSLLVMIIPMGINVWYMIIIKTYFAGIPESLEESARVDGANDIRILVSIIIPVSMPIIATFLLFYGVERWNEWWHATLFINNSKIFPLQRLLRDMIVKNTNNQSMAFGYAGISGSKAYVSTQNVKMATVLVATVPIMVVYPFLQKYFVKGVMIGSIKG